MQSQRKEKIKACIAIAIILLATIITIIISIKYQVEGETNMPFTLSKITIVSTAEGVHNEGANEKWNFNVFQNNDIYFSIEKNEKYTKENMIEKIAIENIQIIKKPEIGEIKTYIPNSSDGRLFNYKEESILQADKVTYKGASKTNNKTLEIGNQGGTAIIRFANIGIGNYISNEEQEIKHDGTMIKKLGIEEDKIKFDINFDFIITLKNTSYKSNITLNLPCEQLLEKGTSSMEIEAMDQFVFKRI